jgi:hypothetical protein
MGAWVFALDMVEDETSQILSAVTRPVKSGRRLVPGACTVERFGDIQRHCTVAIYQPPCL